MSYQALLFCPDERTARLVTQVLSELDFSVEPCNEPFAAVKRLMAQHFDALVVDCDNEQNAALLFKSARNSSFNQASLSVAVVEGQAGVAKAFRIGANLVLTKPINVEQSKGTLRVARGLLRKADGQKAAAPVAPQAPVPAASVPTFRPTAPTSQFQKPVLQPHTPVPPPSMSAFDVERDSGPKLDAADAAMLESLPEPLSPPPSAEAAPSKPYPWQPVSKLAEPMASAMKRAAEAAEKPSIPLAKPAPFPGLPHGGAPAASAPAPAREIPLPKPFETKAAPSLHNLAAEDLAVGPHSVPTFGVPQEATAAGGKKKMTGPIAAVVILALAGAAYYGWTISHPGAKLPLVQKPTVQEPQVQAPAPQSVTPPAAATSAAPTQTAPQAIATEPAPSQTSVIAEDTVTDASEPPAEKPSAALPHVVKPSPASPASHTAASKPSSSSSSQQPILVKNDSAKPSMKPAVPETSAAAAPELQVVGSNGGEQAIAGLVKNTPARMPKAAPQEVRVSQGITQGMVLKRVQPIYPVQAKQLRKEGAVLLEASVGKDGSITRVKVLSGDPMLARAATDAVKQWKYKPYYLNGEPVEIQTQITMNFKLP